jgi:hypothetical protein
MQLVALPLQVIFRSIGVWKRLRSCGRRQRHKSRSERVKALIEIQGFLVVRNHLIRGLVVLRSCVLRPVLDSGQVFLE